MTTPPPWPPAKRTGCAKFRAAKDAATARRRLQALAAFEGLLDVEDSQQLIAWLARGGVEATEADEMRNALIIRRLEAIPGLQEEDLSKVTELLMGYLTDKECRRLLRDVYENWPDEDGTNGTTR